MKIEKLPSGSYRIRKMYKGETYTVITDNKSTQKEAMQLMAEELDRIQTTKHRMLFSTAAENYIDVKSNVLSPSTIRGYVSILANLPEWFTGLIISDVDSINVQKMVNEYSKTHSPKSTDNAHGLVSAVLAMFCPNTILHTTLPQKIKTEPYIPTDSDIRRILEYAKGTKFEIPLMLATYGLRKSEICALTPADLDGNILTINKALVLDKDGNWVIKTTKTISGTRTIYISDDVANLVRKTGHVYEGYPNLINTYLIKIQKELGIPKFNLHKLRHYYASMSHALGIPDSYIMQSGGWKTDGVLKQVYRHALEDKKIFMQKQAADYISGNITGKIS